MTDREPLRVGPLVLKWEPIRTSDDHRPMLPGYVLPGSVWSICQSGSAWVVSAGDRPLGVRWSALENAASDLEAWLTETGYLAQYRSRRRLLAKWCIARANHWAHLQQRHLDKVDQIRRYGTDGEQEREAMAEKCWDRKMQLRALAERLRNG